jgi:hypothetical protein
MIITATRQKTIKTGNYVMDLSALSSLAECLGLRSPYMEA